MHMVNVPRWQRVSPTRSRPFLPRVTRSLAGLGADWGEIVGNIVQAGAKIEAAKIGKQATNAARDAQREADAARLNYLHEETTAQERLLTLKQQTQSTLSNPYVLGGAALALGGVLYFMRRRRR